MSRGGVEHPVAAMTAESLLDPCGGADAAAACAAQEQLPLLLKYVLGDSGDWNLTSKALGQKLADLERTSLEDLAQEIFGALKCSEGTLLSARHAQRRSCSPAVGSAATLSTTCSEGALGVRRPQSSAGTQGGPHYSPSLTPRTPASPPNGKRFMQGSVGIAAGAGALRHRATLSGPGVSARGAAVAASIMASGPDVTLEAEGEAQASAVLRSPRQAVSEAERQQIFDRLYNSAKEQRVRRHTYAELAKLQDEVRFTQDCPFEPMMTSQRRRRPPAQAGNA